PGLRLRVNFDLTATGDEGRDFDVFGVRIQVKTKWRGRKNLVRRVNDRRRLMALGSEVFVFARWVAMDNTVELLGWIDSKELRNHGKNTKSTRAEHWNTEIDEKHLHPMSQLVDRLEYRSAS